MDSAPLNIPLFEEQANIVKHLEEEAEKTIERKYVTVVQLRIEGKKTVKELHDALGKAVSDLICQYHIEYNRERDDY